MTREQAVRKLVYAEKEAEKAVNELAKARDDFDRIFRKAILRRSKRKGGGK